MKRFADNKRVAFLALVLVVVGTAVFYAPSIQYGIFWDDPIWYGHAVGKTWWQTLLPTTDFQFYRPLTILYTWLFLRPDGTFAFAWQHIWQIVFHLLNVIAAFFVSRYLRMSRWAGVALSALLAVYPFAYQAVAWAAPQQPLVGVLQSAAWLSYFAARPIGKADGEIRDSGRKQSFLLIMSLVFFLLALLVQESSVAVAFLPLLYEFLVRQKFENWDSFTAVLRAPRQKSWGWALIYVALAGVYGLIWLAVPRQTGITQLAFETNTLVYLLQGLVYPLVTRPLGYQSPLPLGQFGLLTAVTLAFLLTQAVWHRRGRLALFSLGWLGLGLAPAFVGLEFNYVELASRLLYVAALPVGLLWLAALWPSPRSKSGLAWIGPFFILLILVQSVWVMTGMAQDFGRGTAHLNDAISMMERSEADGRFLFINFPDRYRLRQPPYPYGYWGLTLAPVVVDLADFLPLVVGKTAVSTSFSMPWLDLAEREAGPYQIDMRGVIVQPGELVELADDAAIYVSRYAVDGGFQLQPIGSIMQIEEADCLARFGEAICLHLVDYIAHEKTIEAALVWSTERPLPLNQTVFVHLGQPGQPPLAQADGDTWRGLLPLADWPTGQKITEYRTLPRLPGGAGLLIQIGIYDRETGQRLLTDTAVDYYGIPLP